MNTRKQGDIGVAYAIKYFTVQGYIVSKPLADSQRYDLVVDNGQLKRVEVKSTTFKTPAGTFEVNLKTCGGNQSWNKSIIKISSKDCDLVYIHTPDFDYLFPIDILDGKASLTLAAKYDGYKL